MAAQPVDSHDRNLARTDLANNYIVEAAAGTGKTTVLVDRIINLIAVEKAKPDEIVAITFTERAAAELKMKLQDELGRALERADPRGENNTKTGTETGIKGAAEPKPAATDAEHLAGALWAFERMQVTTIHSFCATLLRERPVEAGIDPNFEVADALSASLIADETWEDWLAREMDGDDPVLRRAVLLGVTLENIYKLGQAIVENRDMLAHLPKPVPLGKTLKDIVKEFKKTAEALQSLKEVYCRKPDDKAAQAIGPLLSLLSTLNRAEKEGELERVFLDGLNLTWRKGLGAKGNWESEEILDEVRFRLEHLKELEARGLNSIHHNALADLAKKLTGYVEAYERAKDRKEVLDFQDLLIYTRDMLARHPEVRRYFSRRYKYILVDEFQDTDPLQAEIIFFLSEKDPGKAAAWEDAQARDGNVFLVGDPKQSIYRFRRADIEMYAAAKGKLGKKRLLNIHQNFRCAPSIVDAANTIFADLIVPSTDGNYQPEYVPLHFGRGKGTVPERHGVVLLHPTERIAAELSDAPTRRMYETRAIAAFIKEIIRDEWPVYDKQEDRIRPVEFRDIAVLMETHSPLPALEDAMRLYEVDYRVIGGKYFYSRQEVQQLAVVLRAIENPYDTVAVVAALRSPFFGVSDEDIFLHHCKMRSLNYLKDGAGAPRDDGAGAGHEGDSRGSVRNAFGILRELHYMRNDTSVEELLNCLYDRTKAPVTYLLKPNGEQRVANLLKIADTARALYVRGVCTLRSFVTWLKEREYQEAEEAEAITVETGDNFIRILTMHKAKGLEFPVTILVDMARVPQKRTEQIIIDRVNNDIAVSIGKKEGIRTINFDALKGYEDRRSQAEDLRLLYVSMTRARDFLVLPAYWAADTERSKKTGELRSGSMMKVLAGHIPGPARPTGHGPPRGPEGGAENSAGRLTRRDSKDAGHADMLRGTIIYDTSRLDLEPEEPPAFRLPLAIEKAERKAKKAGAAEAASIDALEQAHQRSVRQIEVLASKGRALFTPTGEIEFEEEVERGGAPTDGETSSQTPTRGQAAGAGRAPGPGDGAKFGTLVHVMLEAADWETPRDLEALARESASEAGAPVEMVKVATEMVRKALGSSLMKRILKSGAYQKEVPFAVNRDGGIIEGKMDVIFMEGDDLYIVDFKTDRISRKNIKARAEHYRPQAEAYALALKASCGRLPTQVIFFFLHPMETETLTRAT